MLINNNLDQLKSMYPTHAWLLENNSTFELPQWAKFCSVYGYSYGNSTITVDSKTYVLEKGQYFALTVDQSLTATSDNKLFIITRLGYRVPNQVGWVENKGRLSYIDGCSDSLLVYPARLGDSSLNLLYFPPGIDQTFHRHPSIRMGCVIDGNGFSEHGELNNELVDQLDPGTSFCLVEQERHRFKTTDSSMTVIAFHPDGDWGPTDHNHTMLNRTYLDK
jgi:quercetin dioxygenase-like cupin family protein